LAIALAFALGGIYAGNQKGTLAAALSEIGGGTAFHLFVAVLSAFIAYSIADRPGIAPGLVGGMLAQNMGAGFLGGIVSGFLAGYLTKFLADKIKLPTTLEGLKPVLILPFLSKITVGLLMIYFIAPPVGALNHAMNDWLNGMRGANALVLGIILGCMMAFDMGGPVNKAALDIRRRTARGQGIHSHGRGNCGWDDAATGPGPGCLPFQKSLRSRGA
jgi:fructose PTS system EIIBC or EIIC component